MIDGVDANLLDTSGSKTVLSSTNVRDENSFANPNKVRMKMEMEMERVFLSFNKWGVIWKVCIDEMGFGAGYTCQKLIGDSWKEYGCCLVTTFFNLFRCINEIGYHTNDK